MNKVFQSVGSDWDGRVNFNTYTEKDNIWSQVKSTTDILNLENRN